MEVMWWQCSKVILEMDVDGDIDEDEDDFVSKEPDHDITFSSHSPAGCWKI